MISLVVRVPVLSVQITVAAPRVSTAESLFTRAFLRAMRCTPMARDKVRVGSSPSGTKATIMPMAKTRLLSKASLPVRVATRKKIRPMAKATKA